MFDKAIAFPPLHGFFLILEKSTPSTKLQFFLDPTAFHEIFEIIQVCGQHVLELICYLTRTYVYYLYREKQISVGWWFSDNLMTNYSKKRNKKVVKKNLVTNMTFSGSQDVDEAYQDHNP